MEATEGFEYSLDGLGSIDIFAKGILALVNIMSSRKETIAGVSTVEGTNIIIVKAFIDMDEYFDSNKDIWKVNTKEPIKVITEIEFSTNDNNDLDNIYYKNNEEYFFAINE